MAATTNLVFRKKFAGNYTNAPERGELRKVAGTQVMAFSPEYEAFIEANWTYQITRVTRWDELGAWAPIGTWVLRSCEPGSSDGDLWEWSFATLAEAKAAAEQSA
jgi:hypothetical protein